MRRKFHPAAELFPLIQGNALADLVDDIAENGLHEPILLHPDGSILDGRNRYLACMEAGVEPRFETWDRKGSPVTLVLSLNLHRRHLTESQRAMVGAKAKPMFEEEARERQADGGRSKLKANLPEASKGQARDQAASLVNVSPRSIEHASTVLKSGVPEVQKAVDAGDLAVSAAAVIAKQTEEQQRRIVELPKNEQREVVRELRKPLPPSEARKVAIATGIPQATTGNRTVLPMPASEEKKLADGMHAISSFEDAVLVLAAWDRGTTEALRLVDRWLCPRLVANAAKAAEVLNDFVRGLNERSKRVAAGN